MPRFHFHTNGYHDDEGTELDDIAAAKCAAVELAGTILCEEADEFWDQGEWTMTVSTETGLTLLQLQVIGTQAAAVPRSQPSKAT